MNFNEIDQNELKALKQSVYEANMNLVKYHLVIHTWGNVSGISKDRKYFVIKPSGVSYNTLTPDDMVVIDINGNPLTFNKKPSTDTLTHAYLYQKFAKVVAIVHTHSTYATSFAQAGKNIDCYGTTHADNFFGSIPCARSLTDAEINGEYELNTGIVIENQFKIAKLDYVATPACLVKEHGPFCWSVKNPYDAVDLALTLEQVAKMAFITSLLNPNLKEANKKLQQKHYERKHGPNAYYGQK